VNAVVQAYRAVKRRDGHPYLCSTAVKLETIPNRSFRRNELASEVRTATPDRNGRLPDQPGHRLLNRVSNLPKVDQVTVTIDM